MDLTTLLRSCALYEYDQGNSAARNIRKTYYESAMSDSNRQTWFARFTTGNYTLQDIPREDRPVMLDPQALKEVVDANRERWSCWS